MGRVNGSRVYVARVSKCEHNYWVGVCENCKPEKVVVENKGFAEISEDNREKIKDFLQREFDRLICVFRGK